MSVTPSTSPAPVVRGSADDEALFSKVSWRIMPLLIICYIIAFLDRINIGYAQLQMKQTLPFSDAVYGLGAGIFFIGYFLFEVPSNLMLEKIGARKTLLRIMFCWGIVAAGMMFVQTPTQFYVLRFLLGAFEAGFFPGVILYLTYWYPPMRRGQMIAVFMTATTLASVIAGPLCGAHHEVDGRHQRLARLAVAVPGAGPAGVDPWHRLLLLPAGQAGPGALARRRPEAAAARAPRARQAAWCRARRTARSGRR